MKHILFALMVVFVGCADEVGEDPGQIPRPVEDVGMDAPTPMDVPEEVGEDVPIADDVPEEVTPDAIEDAEPSMDVEEEVGDVAVGDAGEQTVPLEGFGAISGECGVIDAMVLGSPMSGFVLNTIDFADDPWDEADLLFLSEGGQEIFNDDNAGGSSKLSEVFAFEVLHRCELADFLKSENEIVYDDPMGKITDILVEIEGQKVGVSVTRAVTFPRDAPYPVEQASDLLGRKLDGVLASSANVSDEDAWVKQVLHVIAYSPDHAESMRLAYEMMSAELQADTIVVVTITDGLDDFLY